MKFKTKIDLTDESENAIGIHKSSIHGKPKYDLYFTKSGFDIHLALNKEQLEELKNRLEIILR